MTEELENLKEARAISRIAQDAVVRLREERDPSLCLVLVNAWSLTSDGWHRRMMGKQVMAILNRDRVDDPEVVREILRHVGTPVCTCPATDAWDAVLEFLGPEHLLSVQLEALGAAVRLTEMAGFEGAPATLKTRVNHVQTLQESSCPEARRLAAAFLRSL